MANGVDYADIGDFANHALAEFYQKPKVQFTSALQDFKLYNWLFKKESLKVSTGNKLEWRYIRSNAEQSPTSAPFQRFDINHEDLFSKGSAEWTQIQDMMVLNELLMSKMSGPAELADYGQGQAFMPVQRIINRLENSAVGVKENSSDTRTADGIPFWLPKLGVGVEDTEGGFNGQTAVYGDGTTTTTIGGTDRATVTGARTAVGTYNGMNLSALDTLRHLQNITKFDPPTEFKEFISIAEPKWRIISGFAVEEAYEALVNAGPDMRNGDANPFSNTITFRGMKWQKVAVMNDLADSPIYGINSSVLFPFVDRKMWMHWSPIDRVQGDQFTHYKQIICQYNFACVNEPQAGFCLHRVRTS